MNATLRDSHGDTISAITCRPTKMPGRLVVEWVAQPDALFQQYFKGRGGDLTQDSSGVPTPTVLATTWVRGTRVWYLDTAAQLPGVASA